jgi:HSP20 family molecular chaperone IbpA
MNDSRYAQGLVPDRCRIHMVTMPADVTEDDVKASFKNGILEVRLKKRVMPQKSGIVIG